MLVVGGDMPYLVPAVLRLLIGGSAAALADSERHAWPGRRVGWTGNGPRRPPRSCWPRRAAAPKALLTRLNATALAWSDWQAADPGGRTLVDIDERADLDRKQRDPDLSIGVSREEEPGP